MDYEKKYKEALELARVAAFNGHQSLMEGIFPELAESEDEKTRKEIIYHIKNCDDTIDEETEKRMIAWLEKQGEQKHAWSEEDDVMIKVFDSIIRYIVEVVDKDVLERFGTNREELFSWLKSLKQRMGG